MYLNFDQRLKEWITSNQAELTSIGYIVDDVDYIVDQQLTPIEFLLQIYNELDSLSFSNSLTFTFMFEFYDIDIFTKSKKIEKYKTLNPGRVFCEKLKNKVQNSSKVKLEVELTKLYEPHEKYLKNEIICIESDFFDFSNKEYLTIHSIP